MVHSEYQYLKLMSDIIKNGKSKHTRGIHDIKSVFGTQVRFDMRQGFPLLTTKQMPFKILLHELFWFISGSSEVQYLQSSLRESRTRSRRLKLLAMLKASMTLKKRILFLRATRHTRELRLIL
jgi:thymidylate synthase